MPGILPPILKQASKKRIQGRMLSVGNGMRPLAYRKSSPPATFSAWSAPLSSPGKYRRCARWPRAALDLLAPAGHFTPGATALRADASLRCASGRFAAFGGNSPPGWCFPPRHRARASGFARSIVAEGAGCAHRSFRGPPSGRFALRATAHRADASLRCAPGRFATSGGKCPQGTRFPSRLPGFGAEPQSLMPQHFLRALRAPEGRKQRGFL